MLSSCMPTCQVSSSGLQNSGAFPESAIVRLQMLEGFFEQHDDAAPWEHAAMDGLWLFASLHR